MATTTATGTTGVSSLANPARVQKIKAQAKEFESVFIAQMLNSMTSSLSDKTGFDGGHAEQQWRTIQNEYTAKAIVAKGGIGLASQIAGQLLKVQESAR